MNLLSERERERLARTLQAIPDDAYTGLEIGFHELFVTRQLAQRLDLVSVDVPHPVRNNEGLKLAFADIQSLPFADSAFDVVVCTEVLEHLPDSVLKRGVSELRRVARKHVLITVPYLQELRAGLFKCARCGHVCHAQGHVQRFDAGRVLGLFPGARAIRTETIASVPGHAPAWMYAFANHVGNSWQPLIFGDECPGCNAPAQAPTANVLGALTRRILWRIERFANPRPAWLLVVLEIDAVA